MTVKVYRKSKLLDSATFTDDGNVIFGDFKMVDYSKITLYQDGYKEFFSIQPSTGPIVFLYERDRWEKEFVDNFESGKEFSPYELYIITGVNKDDVKTEIWCDTVAYIMNDNGKTIQTLHVTF